MTRILVIDNYDSFVHNLAHYLEQLGAKTDVRRNDAVTVEAIAAGGYAGVLVSPGPGTPAEAGVTEDAVRWAAEAGLPLLGVCLGMQAVADVFGAVVDRAPKLMHGRTSQIEHDGTGLFAGVPQPMTATRYHSLAVVDGTVPAALEVTARADDGVIMGIRHRTATVEGVQFHPESVLTRGGYRLLANWLARCGAAVPADLVDQLAAELDAQRRLAG